MTRGQGEEGLDLSIFEVLTKDFLLYKLIQIEYPNQEPS